MQDEAHPLLHVDPDLVDPVARRSRGRVQRRRPADHDRSDQRRRDEEADHVDDVADARRERGDDCAGRRGPDDAAAQEGELHERVRRQQAVHRHVRPDRHGLRRTEERRDAAERGEHDVDLPDGRRRNQQHRQHRADQVARDQRRLERPPIDEHAGNRADEHDRQHVGDLQPRQLRRRAVHAERHDGNHREQREEVPEQADDLREPHVAHHVDAQHVPERQRRCRRGGRAGCRRCSGHGKR